MDQYMAFPLQCKIMDFKAIAEKKRMQRILLAFSFHHRPRSIDFYCSWFVHVDSIIMAMSLYVANVKLKFSMLGDHDKTTKMNIFTFIKTSQKTRKKTLLDE